MVFRGASRAETDSEELLECTLSKMTSLKGRRGEGRSHQQGARCSVFHLDLPYYCITVCFYVTCHDLVELDATFQASSSDAFSQ